MVRRISEDIDQVLRVWSCKFEGQSYQDGHGHLGNGRRPGGERQRNIYGNVTFNNTLCMKIDGNWTKTKLLGLSLKDIWKQQDNMRQQSESLNGSNITLLGTEKVDGTECFKVKVIPDIKSYAAVEKEQLGSITILPYLNISSLFNDTSISYISWISKDKHILLKTENRHEYDL
jgi:hypothetical protein